MVIQDLPFWRSSSDADPMQKPLVFAVDDDEDNLLLLEYCLELFNCQFVSSTEGRNLVALAQKAQPHLILLDVVMPGQSGTELLHELRNNPQTCNIPVVAVTALAALQDKMRLLAEGFDDYLGKPFMLNDLQSTIDRYCCPQAVQV